ncbi:MAG: oxidoreductase [Betaproteobacteria bacterium]|nr:MAG: oxidoreductase [Betaproteobacteria bacterium]
MQKFKAYRTFQEDNNVSSRFVEMSLDELDPGDVVVKTKYSTINYKDALSYNGAGKIMRKYPTVAGIDMAGTVDTSSDPRFKHGDKVIVHAYDLGVAHHGGYAEYVRVPPDWVVRRSPNMTAFEAMTLGTAGFTAAQAIELMQHNGLTPRSGPVIVDGATGGVGSVAIDILSKLGYHVVAMTQSIDFSKIRPLDRSMWAGAIDNLGGEVLSWMLSTMKQGGTVASVGLAADAKLMTTVMPFILRGVHLLGVNSAEVPMPLRQKLWDRLANEWRPSRVQSKVITIDFADLPTHFDAFLKGMDRGRTVVRVGADTAGL